MITFNVGGSTTTCVSKPDPNDSDGDGVQNAQDNCPQIYNKAQQDGFLPHMERGTIVLVGAEVGFAASTTNPFTVNVAQGIAGALVFDAGIGGPNAPDGPPFMSPEWRDHLKFALQEAQRLGIEISLNLCSGWNAGGPWVKPEQAMKKLVWSKTTVEGPRPFAGKLPQPPSCNGSFQNQTRGGRRPQQDPTWYGDSAVIAFPTPTAEVDMVALNPKVTTSGWRPPRNFDECPRSTGPKP